MKLDIQTVVDLRFPVEDTDPKRVPICDLANFSEFHGIEKIVIREGGGGGGYPLRFRRTATDKHLTKRSTKHADS